MPLLPTNALLALGSATLWGGGDFSGGMGVRNAGGTTRAALRIVLVSHLFSFAVLALVVALRRDALPHGALLGWALLAGLCASVSLTCFYMALSHGAMGASAAISGLLAAVIPALVSLVVEGAPTPRRLAGFVVAAVAIWLIAASPAKQRAERATMLLACIAGLGFGVYFTALRMANPLGIYVPMATARIASICTTLVFLLCLSARRSDQTDRTWRLSGTAIIWALAAGSLDTIGNLLFIAATRSGRLDVAAVLASLYPASTIVLAAWLLKERLSRRQCAGMAVAVAAVAMITL